MIAPIIFFILIKGWLFDKSWRKKRLRNTTALLLLFSLLYAFNINPAVIIPSFDYSPPSEFKMALWENLRMRLSRMYGDAEKIPEVAPRTLYGARPKTPLSGQRILKEAALYFLPDSVERDLESVYTRTAKLGGEGLKLKSAGARFERFESYYARSGLGGPSVKAERDEWGTGLSHESGSVLSQLGDAVGELILPKQAQAFYTDWSGSAIGPDNNSTIHFFHTDHLGSTRVVTDIDGSVYERIDYLPFGEIFRDDVAQGGDYEKHRQKYTGQMYDYFTGLYYYGARYYDAETGRFTQADTIVPEPLDGQTFNRYTYVNNNPYKYTDPSGHVGVLAAVAVAAISTTVATVGTAAAVTILTAAAVGFMSYMVAGALMSAITGQNCISGDGIGGAVAGSILRLIPGVSEIMLAVSLIQLCQAVHSGQGGQAALGLVCGLIGGVVSKIGYHQAQNFGDYSWKNENDPRKDLGSSIEMPETKDSLYIFMQDTADGFSLENRAIARFYRFCGCKVIMASSEQHIIDGLEGYEGEFSNVVFVGHGKPGSMEWYNEEGQTMITGFVKGSDGKISWNGFSMETRAALSLATTFRPNIIFYTCWTGAKAGDYGYQFSIKMSRELGPATIITTSGSAEQNVKSLGVPWVGTLTGGCKEGTWYKY